MTDTPSSPPRAASRLGPVLAIETATLQAGVALVDTQGRELASRRARVTTHSEQLLALVAEVLDEGGLTGRLEELGAIACGAGPGSFTGLRIGLATAKGLCLATGVPLVMVSSLRALAARVQAGDGGCIVVPCIDAFKGEVYAGFYARAANDESNQRSPLRSLQPEAVLAPERLAEWITEWIRSHAADVSVHLIGDGSTRWPVLEQGGVITTDRAPPDPVDVARLAAVRAAAGDFDDLDSAIPTYIRPSEAELKGPPPMPSRDH